MRQHTSSPRSSAVETRPSNGGTVADTPIAIETDKNLLVVALADAGFIIDPINPLSTRRVAAVTSSDRRVRHASMDWICLPDNGFRVSIPNSTVRTIAVNELTMRVRSPARFVIHVRARSNPAAFVGKLAWLTVAPVAVATTDSAWLAACLSIPTTSS
ncbi:hypothetical protein R4P64_31950 [Rhodococcus sp. IEGM 1366]|uniref:hypothetical protein n=1 Tax=Rhodococcus sp. IEGM 1366 TaxID=3082223 RepID=UPI0029542651|nr:hypothetical protein [Rhodococcus sp. IEGM 1366]MDV8071135.1 hypothetical protein [Rhodococcus sp. IEGM 1366]